MVEEVRFPVNLKPRERPVRVIEKVAREFWSWMESPLSVNV
jgi:hypothetical protein